MIKFAGIIVITMWASYVPYLFHHPFQERKDVKEFVTELTQDPNWIKQETSFKGETADELEKAIMTDLRINWIISVLFIVIGLLSGFLLIKNIEPAYLFTFFFLSLVVIGGRFAFSVMSEHYLEYYIFRLTLVKLIQDVLMQLVLLGTMIFLTYVYATRERGRFISQRHNNTNTADINNPTP